MTATRSQPSIARERQRIPGNILNLFQRHPMMMIGALLLAEVILVLAIGGYFLGWNWTGFKGNTFWDWMSLLITPVTLAIISIGFTMQQGQRSLAMNSQLQQDSALEAYFDHISHLLLESHLLDTTADSPVRAVARARTITTLQLVSQEHQASLLRFLDESGLTSGEIPILDLRNANIGGPVSSISQSTGQYNQEDEIAERPDDRSPCRLASRGPD